jgi:hypothetical protein
LEVYYDAKNYTSGVVQDLSTNSFNGTLTNGASYNNSDGISKFAFDAGTNQYMTTTTTQTGEYIHTTSMWMKFSESTSSQHYLFTMGGTSGGFSRIGMYYSANNGIRVTSGVDYRSRFHPTPGEWFHVTYTYSGGTLNQGASDVNVKFYINGSRWMFQDYYQGGGTTPTALNLPGTNTLQINGQNGANNIYIDTEVGNFRLFNRALTSDEIYQLYAYQKEYFGHGTLGMTLKAGRLGIGTSEPRAALDVRGGFYAHGSVVQIQTNVFTNTASTSDGTWKDISSTFSVTITPKFENSIFLLQAMIHQGGDQSTDARWTMYRIGRYVGGVLTEVGNGDPSNTGGNGSACVAAHNWGSSTTAGSYDYMIANINMLYVDQPNTTSSLTYRIRWNSNPGAAGTRQAWINRAESHTDGFRANTISTLVVTEIAQ